MRLLHRPGFGRTRPAGFGSRGTRHRRLGPAWLAFGGAALLLAAAVPAVGWDQVPQPPAGPAGYETVGYTTSGQLFADPPSPGSYEPPWSWPLSPAPPVIRPFEAPPQRWLAGHRGVDLLAAPGAPVLSPAAGTVTFAGWVVNRPVMTVDLGGGLLTSFEPVDPAKSAGDAVAEGDVLGHVAPPASAEPAHCVSSCLHWGVRLNREYVNPLNYVTDRRPSVLLPLLR